MGVLYGPRAPSVVTHLILALAGFNKRCIYMPEPTFPVTYPPSTQDTQLVLGVRGRNLLQVRIADGCARASARAPERSCLSQAVSVTSSFAKNSRCMYL
eukprot:7613408-Pyramimonas_sp.AAC.1